MLLIIHEEHTRKDSFNGQQPPVKLMDTLRLASRTAERLWMLGTIRKAWLMWVYVLLRSSSGWCSIGTRSSKYGGQVIRKRWCYIYTFCHSDDIE